LAELLTRRWVLLVAAGGFASGLVTRQILSALAPAVADGTARGTAPSVASAVPSLPMEEEPLPHDVHLTAARIDRPPPALPPNAAPVASSEPHPATAAPQTPPMAAAAPPVPVMAPTPPVRVAPPVPATALPSRAAPVGGQASWLRNARPFVDTAGRPAIAIVIDDLGLGAEFTRRAIALDSAVTLALMTYAPRLADWSGAARAAKHEILVHVPMQPLNGKIDPGPRALTVALSDAEILDRLRWGLGRLDGYVGINNHMGSRFTQDRAGMSVVMEEIKSRGLLFLDSVTIGRTVGSATAAPMRVPFAERNVFLDDQPTVAGVSHQLAVLEQVARRHGTAIAIGHPHEATLSVLAQWLPSAAARGVAVVPLTSVVRRQYANA
jgi:polysaccharide deacetylase 2 family uncharacterized protein YibQ